MSSCFARMPRNEMSEPLERIQELIAEEKERAQEHLALLIQVSQKENGGANNGGKK